MIRYNQRVWNVHSFVSENAKFTLVNRTNNLLERFNRQMNEFFPTPHAPMSRFVETIRKIFEEYVSDLGRIQKGTMAKPVHLPVTVYEIPESYTNFEP